jgi:sec-independent protein translocase protein TatC
MTAKNKREDEDAPGGAEQPFMSHLVELRDRLLRCVLAVLVMFLLLAPFANTLYSWLAAPLLRHMPAGTSMIATEGASPFLTPFKLALVLAIFLAVPFLFYQAWAFVAPGLYRHERQLVLPLVVSSTVLFYLGMAFAYFLVFPLVFAFLTSTAPEGVAVMTDISKYLDFVLKMFFAFGVAFEVPIATILLVWAGVTTPEQLTAKRPYIIVGAFVVGMLLTPPDVISQTLLAVPMWMLFELGVWLSRRFMRQRAEAADAQEPDGPEDPEAELDRIEAEARGLVGQDPQPSSPSPAAPPAETRYTQEGLADELALLGQAGGQAGPPGPGYTDAELDAALDPLSDETADVDTGSAKQRDAEEGPPRGGG